MMQGASSIYEVMKVMLSSGRQGALRWIVMPLVFLIWLIAPTACAEDDRLENRVLLYDSAGIWVVENRDTSWSVEPWRVSDDAALTIGAMAGPPEYEFFNVVDAERLSDGRIAVADQGSAEIRIYDPLGAFERSFGRLGEGPGEFQFLSSIQRLPGDSILAFDGALDRATVFSRSGEVASVITFEKVIPGTPSQIVRLADGSFVSGFAWSSSYITSEQRRSGFFFRFPTPLTRFSSEGVLVDTLGVFPGREMTTWEFANGFANTSAFPFSRNMAYAVDKDRVFVGTQEAFEIRVYDLLGRLTGLIRAPEGNLAITDTSIAGLRERTIRSVMRSGEEEAAAVAMVDENWLSAPLPPRKPAYGEVLLDGEGVLWVSEWVGVYGIQPAYWSLFDREGRLLGRLGTPENLRVLDIGRDYILGSWSDSLNVEYVQQYALYRGG